MAEFRKHLKPNLHLIWILESVPVLKKILYRVYSREDALESVHNLHLKTYKNVLKDMLEGVPILEHYRPGWMFTVHKFRAQFPGGKGEGRVGAR
jgi:hypothetical protein